MKATADEVRLILNTTLSNDSLEAFINSADVVVNNMYAEENVSEAVKHEVCLWLSAHFAAMRERQETEVEISGSRAKFGGKFGDVLRFTQYGQQVLLLDPTGKFADAGETKALMEVIEYSGAE